MFFKISDSDYLESSKVTSIHLLGERLLTWQKVLLEGKPTRVVDCTKHFPRRALILTTGKNVYISRFTPETLAKRCEEATPSEG